jgi:hypothetical protein
LVVSVRDRNEQNLVSFALRRGGFGLHRGTRW